MTSHKRKLDTEEKEEGPAQKRVDVKEGKDTECWKPCFDREGKEIPIEASSQGRVRNAVTGQVRRPTSDRYGRARLAACHSTYFVAQLVCRAFHGPPPTPQHLVRHVDGDPANDAEPNLEWATRTELRAKAKRAEGGRSLQVISTDEKGQTRRYATVKEAADATGVSRWQITECAYGRREAAGGLKWSRAGAPRVSEKIEGEEWRGVESPLSRYEVSNMGRVRNKVWGSLLSVHIQAYGYAEVCMRDDDGKGCNRLIHGLVARAFLPTPPEGKNQVDHVNGRRDDNRVENLQFVSGHENVARALGRPVAGVDDEGKEIRFASATDAARSVQVHDSAITKCIRGGWRCKGYRWRYTDKEEQKE